MDSDEIVFTTAKLNIVVNNEERVNVVMEQVVHGTGKSAEPKAATVDLKCEEKHATVEGELSDLQSAAIATDLEKAKPVDSERQTKSQKWMDKSQANDASLSTFRQNRPFSKLGVSRTEDTYSQITANAEESQRTQVEMSEFERTVDRKLARKLGSNRKSSPAKSNAESQHRLRIKIDKIDDAHHNLMPYEECRPSTTKMVSTDVPVDAGKRSSPVDVSIDADREIREKSKDENQANKRRPLPEPPRKPASVSADKGKQLATSPENTSGRDPGEISVVPHWNLMPYTEPELLTPNQLSSKSASSQQRAHKPLSKSTEVPLESKPYANKKEMEEKVKIDADIEMERSLNLVPKPSAVQFADVAEERSEQRVPYQVKKVPSEDSKNYTPHLNLMPYGETRSQPSSNRLPSRSSLKTKKSRKQDTYGQKTPCSGSRSQRSEISQMSEYERQEEIELERAPPANFQKAGGARSSEKAKTAAVKNESEIASASPVKDPSTNDAPVLNHSNLMPFSNI